MADTMGHSAIMPRETLRWRSASAAGDGAADFRIHLVVRDDLRLGRRARPAAGRAGHATALLAGAPGALFGSFGADTKKASSDVLLALIYSYPLFAVAILTLFMTIRSAQDYVGGVVLIALALFALWASSDLQGMRGFSFGAGTAPRMFGVCCWRLAPASRWSGL